MTSMACSYVFSFLLKKVFLFKCNLSMLRLTTMLSLLALPIALTPLISYNKRERPPPSLATPLLEAVILASFPIAWFFGFLYYTEVPSLVSVVSTVVFASQGRHWLAALVRVDLPVATERRDSRSTSMAVRPGQLHIPSEQHHLGGLRIWLQSSRLPSVPARPTECAPSCEAP